MSDVVKLTTPPFVVAYPSVFKASKGIDADSKEKFSLTAIWNPANFSAKDKERWQAIIDALDAETKHRFKKGWKDFRAANPKNAAIRASKDRDKPSPGFDDGTYFATLSSQFAPGVIALDKSEISLEAGNSDEIYAGVVCRATINIYSYDNRSKGVSLGLQSLQKIKDGPKLFTRNAADDFDDDLDSSWLDQAEESLDENVSDIPF